MFRACRELQREFFKPPVEVEVARAETLVRCRTTDKLTRLRLHLLGGEFSRLIAITDRLPAIVDAIKPLHDTKLGNKSPTSEQLQPFDDE